MKYKLDDLDRKIIDQLMGNLRRSFQEIARALNVSGGTVHLRYNRLKEEGYIGGSRLIIDYDKLGFGVRAFVGVNLHNAVNSRTVIEKLKGYPEILEAHYTTGSYHIFLKVIQRDIAGLHRFLADCLQSLPEVQSTETILSLNTAINRELEISRIDCTTAPT